MEYDQQGDVTVSLMTKSYHGESSGSLGGVRPRVEKRMVEKEISA